MERNYLYFIITVLSATISVFYIQKTEKDIFSIFANQPSWSSQSDNSKDEDLSKDEDIAEESEPEQMNPENEISEPEESTPPEQFNGPVVPDNSPILEEPRSERRFQPLKRLRGFIRRLCFFCQ